MAYGSGTLSATSASAVPQRASGLKESAKALWNSYWAFRAQRATSHILHSLDDRTLADIGIERSEIESVIRDTSRQRLRTYDPKWE
jgi:uncharacterized protein YjiS (DUF1127 family)